MIIAILTLLAVAAITAAIIERRRSTQSLLQRHYLRWILLAEGNGDRYLDTLSPLSSKRIKLIASQVIAQLTPIVYRLEPNQLTSISHTLHLPEFLLNKAKKSHGSKRIKFAALLSTVPCPHLTTQELAPLSDDKNRMVRLFALITTIKIDPSGTLKYIAAHPSPLTPFELSQLLDTLQQGAFTVAYQPLLGANNTNLKMLGMAIVREFNIEASEQELRRILDSDPCDTLRLEALYTLACLQCTICTPSIKQYVREMRYHDREQFLRFIATEGYCQEVVDFFTTPYEREDFHSLINSYKIKMKCS